MSFPRRLNRGACHSVCRRTIDRKPLLRPDPRTLAIERYTFFLIASRYQASVDVFVGTFLATHQQGVYRDRLGGEHSRLPDFFRDLNSNLARALNARHERGGAFWEAGTYSNTEIHGELSEEAQWLYMYAQGAEAGIVRDPDTYPGTMVRPEDVGTVIRVQRPDDAWFGSARAPGPSELAVIKAQAKLEAFEAGRRKRGKKTKAGRREQAEGEKLRRRLEALLKEQEAERRAALAADRARAAGKPGAKPQERARPKQGRSTLPEWVEYYVPVPPFLAHLSVEEARLYLRRAADRYVAEIHARREAEGWDQVIGLERALSIDPHRGAGDPLPEFALNPRIACQGVGAIQRRELYEELTAWRKRHAEELEVFEGEHPERARFPPGTYRRAQEVTRFQRRLRGPPRAA